MFMVCVLHLDKVYWLFGVYDSDRENVEDQARSGRPPQASVHRPKPLLSVDDWKFGDMTSQFGLTKTI